MPLTRTELTFVVLNSAFVAALGVVKWWALA